MLDDQNFLKHKDPAKTLEIAKNLWQQLEHQFEFNLQNSFKPQNIVYVGMGGSALAGLISQTWPGYNLPFELVRGYSLPKYVNQDTLIILSSYSGDTEETISALNEGLKKTKQVVLISSGGKLEEIASRKNLTFIKIPAGLQPRYAVFYNLKVLVDLFFNLGLVTKDKILELKNASKFLKESIQEFIPENILANNLAKQIALKSSGKSLVIYSGPKFFPAAYKWKISFNENAKQIAWCNQYSEFNHNEFIGWTKQPILKPYQVIQIESNLEDPRIQKRFQISRKLLSGLMPDPEVIIPKGNNLIEQLLYAIVLGDFTSIYTALLSNVNPEPVKLIEKLKKELE